MVNSKIEILNQDTMRKMGSIPVPEGEIVTCATGSEDLIFVGLKSKKILVFAKYGAFEFQRKIKLIEQPLCMTEIGNKMVVVGLKGTKSTGYALVNIQDDFKVENKLSSLSKKKQEKYEEGDDQNKLKQKGSDIVQIIAETTKPGFVCVTKTRNKPNDNEPV